MRKNEKILILCLLAVLVIVVIVINVNKGKKGENTEQEQTAPKEEYVQVLKDGTKLNTSEALSKEKNVDGLVFKNIQLTTKNGQTVLLADVTNTNSKKTDLTEVEVIILDKTGKELQKIVGLVAPLEAGASTQFNTSVTLDYANAYDFKIVKK